MQEILGLWIVINVVFFVSLWLMALFKLVGLL